MFKKTVVPAVASVLVPTIGIVEIADAHFSCQNRVESDLASCDMVPGPHSRTLILSATTSSASLSVGFIYQVYDADDYQMPPKLPIPAVDLSAAQKYHRVALSTGSETIADVDQDADDRRR
jgi:hypothetical protein